MAKKKGSTTAAKRRSTSVPDSYRGFSLQATRVLYYLLKAKHDDVVSLEYFEDVGVEKPDGSKTAEQVKSYRSRNPLTDRSVVLWKTLRNWVDAARTGTLPPDKTTFVVYAPNASMGDIFETFHCAKTIDQAEKALARAREVLVGTDGLDISKAAKEHVDVVFSADVDIVAEIIVQITVDATDESPEEALKLLLREELIGEDSFDLESIRIPALRFFL